MPKKNAPTLECKPVAWNNDKVTKYQAMVVFREKGHDRIIAGNQKSTETDALESLAQECDMWIKRAEETKELIKNQ